MILHVATLDKFIPPFVKFVQREFQEERHQFWFTGSVEKYPVEQSETVFVCKNGFWSELVGYAKLVRTLHSARKVMLHGLFNIRVVAILALCPWILPKCHWIIWGGDLYQYKQASNELKSRIKEALRYSVIRRMGHLVTCIEGDVDLARQWYGALGTHHECLVYLSNVVDPQLAVEVALNRKKSRLNILLGNSADPGNNHIEAFERLLAYKGQNIKIYAPLSYGDEDYANKVIAQGHAWFGDKFVPMTDFMPFEQYLEFLKSVDIAIFNHRRQQAMGNTITLLAMGKRVFMRRDVSHWRFLHGLGIKLNDVEELQLQPIEREEARKNACIIHSYFCKATLVRQLSDIFEGKDGLSKKRNTAGHGV
ncbi:MULTISPECIES: TDP-N-acetylfucosamine:lipid II N-acetylfucosaminyltransferase [Marinobacter]|uniref:TDP-N-acetylfucosamine:lipid II N-acetylfucosaminyltransferase n=1 Tax=Marinobacter TaxID=2742 RepID=UPI001785E97A|nr:MULTISPECIES: TDP-N-acetylfucosamine:lipid II N-acetylfucosaminyltransferase [Marinobacter]MBL3554929.1 TDP-N-acetylfucosamine:lipid II N-acetylfucosaminyltransferase [Marinobacter sp. JB05H06]